MRLNPRQLGATAALLVLASIFHLAFVSGETHEDNWAVLVSTSRYWFNYRHTTNVLALYQQIRRLGIPDSNIILMISEDMACNPRNALAGSVFSRHTQGDLYDDTIEVDYKGYDVNPENFLRVLLDRHPIGTPNARRLLSTNKSNILIYLTGHGGDQFIKFHDQEELSASQIANTLNQMFTLNRYHEILFIADTCQATTLYNKITSPNILHIGSSGLGENSYSAFLEKVIGVSMIDRFTHSLQDFLIKHNIGERRTLHDFWSTLRRSWLLSNPAYSDELMNRTISQIPIDDFFSAKAASSRLRLFEEMK